jgi:ABC-2 type transport system permease protein
MGSMDGVRAIWYREAKVFIREKSRIVASIVSPILWLFVFGGGLGGRVSVPGSSYQAFIFPGVLAQAVLFTSIFFGVYVVWDRKVDFLKAVLVAPVSRTSIFLGKVLGGGTDAMLQVLILLVLGTVCGRIGIIPGLHISAASFLASFAVLALTTIAFTSVGLIVGSQMESPEGFQLVSSFFVFPMFFLSGALFPIDRLPAWLAPFTMLDPLTYAIDAMRRVILGASQFSLPLDLAVLGGFTVLVIGLGAIAFDRMKV